jgi:hypothetical protein
MYKAQAGIIECRDGETVERKTAAAAISLYSPPYKVLLYTLDLYSFCCCLHLGIY